MVAAGCIAFPDVATAVAEAGRGTALPSAVTELRLSSCALWEGQKGMASANPQGRERLTTQFYGLSS